MEPVQTERARNPDAGKVRADQIARRKNKVEDAVAVVRGQVEAGGADKVRVKIAVVAGAIKIDNATQSNVLLPVNN